VGVGRVGYDRESAKSALGVEGACREKAGDENEKDWNGDDSGWTDRSGCTAEEEDERIAGAGSGISPSAAGFVRVEEADDSREEREAIRLEWEANDAEGGLLRVRVE
jgi:hypothetical protein